MASATTRPAYRDILDGIRNQLEKNYPSPVDISVEYLRTAPPLAADYQDRLHRWIAYKHGNETFDAIVALRPEAVVLARDLRKRLWPNAPIVYLMLKNEYTAEFAPGPGITGLVMDNGHEDTIQAALHLLPETRHVALIGGAAEADRIAHRQTEELIRSQFPGIDLISLDALTLEELKSRVSELPPATIIYDSEVSFDRNGRRLNMPELVTALHPVANRPIFSKSTLAFGIGIVGGPMNSYGLGGEYTGQVLAKVLAGAQPETLPLVRVPKLMAVDWRELKRWNIPESAVPKDTEIRFRQVTLWEKHQVAILAIAGAILVQILVIGILLLEKRKRALADRGARSHAELNRAILASLTGRIAIVDQAGRIIRVSSNWHSSEDEMPFQNLRAGLNYSDVWRDWKELVDGQEALFGLLQSVLAGERNTGLVLCRTSARQTDQWFEIRVERLNRTEGGAVITHTDVTAQKRESLERRKALEDLYHMNRVVTVGELAGSFAHELAQPLTAILTNAQAALRFADSGESRKQEISETLQDIVKENLTARAMIGRLRGILKKKHGQSELVDLNRIVHEVTGLTRSVTEFRGVQIRLDLHPQRVVVRGDSISLYQVLLNLLSNGMDAVGDRPADNRSITIRTARQQMYGELLVEDNGPGIPDHVRERIFESFYTTKPEGLGMGLSICRSIVESLAGQIEVRNLSEAGAVFRVVLPLSTRAVAQFAEAESGSAQLT